MLSGDFKTLIAPQVKVLNIIWLAFLAATLIYAFIAWIMFGMNSSAALETPELTRLGSLSLNQAGLLVLVLLAITATYYQRWALSPGVVRKKVPSEPVWPPLGSQTNAFSGPGGREIFDRLSETEKKMAGLWPHYQTSMIVVWAMLEAIAVVGLVLAILQRDFMVVVPMSAAALALLVLKRPQPGGFYENIRL